MVFKTILILVVIAVLMEDTTSVRKSEEEKREDRELAELVNKTLAEEKTKEDEKKRREDEKKKKTEDKTKGKLKDTDKKKDSEDQVKSQDKIKTEKDLDKASPPCDFTCPDVESCGPCPGERPCPKVEDCLPCKECGTCPPCKPCPRCEEPEECPPVLPCPVDNSTRGNQDLPPSVACPEVSSMPTAVAVAVGASAALLAVGAATGVGLLLRYVPPVVCGFLFVATVIIVWYLCSHYPEAAREIGGRVVAVLREAILTLSNRVMAAIRHHNAQVGFPV
jgi:hypothetical protein